MRNIQHMAPSKIDIRLFSFAPIHKSKNEGKAIQGTSFWNQVGAHNIYIYIYDSETH